MNGDFSVEVALVLRLAPSVVTPKPANGGQGKTGQREEAGD
jgi:hypothetical protein